MNFVLKILGLLLCCCALPSYAQISGTITDTNGEPLAFASIYIEGTSMGTSSNVEGIYQITPDSENFTLVYQYVGYKTHKKQISYQGKPQSLDIQLKEESVTLGEIVVKANAEDPAYPIIRKAMAKRKFYLNQTEAYSCDVYIKGTQKLLNAPDAILGQELGDLGGILDSTRQGIVYLSESESKLYYQKPNSKKEVMVSSKVAGDDNGFSFNQASLMDFNFYENAVEIDRPIISPIGNNAFLFYKYQLAGSYFDENGFLVYKIKLIPKGKEEPAFGGYIYIVDELWNIHSTDFYISGSAIKQPILDTLCIRQLHIPLAANDEWCLFSQSIDIRFGALGFEVDGNFTGVFSNYNFDPVFEDGFFSNEIFKVEELANEKDKIYWDSIRPILLTLEEQTDYVRKDSLSDLWKSKVFLDSIDRENNKFKIVNLLLGYNYNRSYKKQYYSFSSPLSTIQFDPYRGFYGALKFGFRKDFDDENIRWILVEPKFSYGLAEKRLRISAEATFSLEKVHFSKIRLRGGRVATQFDETNPLSRTVNTFYALYGKLNLMRLYEKDFVAANFERELFNGFFMETDLEYTTRRALGLSTHYSFLKKEAYYDDDFPDFEKHRALITTIKFRIRPGQKYLTYPNRKFISGSKYPDFLISYKKGIPLFDGSPDFDLLSIGIKGDYQLGFFGKMEFRLEAGQFLNSENVYFMDRKHFHGNRTISVPPDQFLNRFLALPYYDYSTTKPHFQAHFYHHFQGLLTDRIPLVKRMNLTLVFGSKWLFVEGESPYTEYSLGIDNLGFGAFRLFRLEFITAFKAWNYEDFRVVLGTKL